MMSPCFSSQQFKICLSPYSYFSNDIRRTGSAVYLLCLTKGVEPGQTRANEVLAAAKVPFLVLVFLTHIEVLGVRETVVYGVTEPSPPGLPSSFLDGPSVRWKEVKSPLSFRYPLAGWCCCCDWPLCWEIWHRFDRDIWFTRFPSFELLILSHTRSIRTSESHSMSLFCDHVQISHHKKNHNFRFVFDPSSIEIFLIRYCYVSHIRTLHLVFLSIHS